MRGTPISVSLIVCLACGGGATGPRAPACASQEGIRVCADRSEYRPGDVIGLTVTNTGNATVFKDFCSTEIVGRTSNDTPFEVDYDPSLLCGQDVTLEEIVADMIELAPGASIREEHRIVPFAFQGFYRVNVWILDESGTPISTGPYYSGTFEVYPTARR